MIPSEWHWLTDFGNSFKDICLVLLNVRDNEKFEMQPFFYSYYDLYTTDDTERIHETERMQIKYLKTDVLLPLEGEIHEEGKSQMTEDVGRNISEDIRK